MKVRMKYGYGFKINTKWRCLCALCGVGDSHCNPLPSLLLLPFCGVLFHPTLRRKKESLKGNLVFICENYAIKINIHRQIMCKIISFETWWNKINFQKSKKKTSPSKENIQHFKNMIFFTFWISGSGSAFPVRIRIQLTKINADPEQRFKK